MSWIQNGIQYWMLKAGFGLKAYSFTILDVNDAWEDPENSVWGVGCPEIFILVFLFHRGQCGPDLPFEAIGPTGSYFFPRLSITVFLRKHITTFDLPAGVQTLCPPPLGHTTHAMLSSQSGLCSSVSCLSA